MKLIVGLGNPGVKYKFTRHNLGSLIVEAVAEKLRIKFRHSFFAKAKITSSSSGNEEIMLALPLTFMNLSGRTVSYLIKKRNIGLGDILVVCDDVNLDLGKLRVRSSGSDGGHNGLKSVVESLGSNEFSRLRIGIGPGEESDLASYVLEEFNREERKELKEIIEKSVEAVLYWVNFGTEAAMNKYNSMSSSATNLGG